MALRPLLLALLAVCAVVLAGCGNKQDLRTLGETEGIYVDVADLSYQVQISRVLNENDVEDRAYLRGLPAGTAPPGRDETWFAIFLRVSNPSKQVKQPSRSFRIVDTLENEYEPLSISAQENPFAYDPRPLPPGRVLPDPNSVSGEGDIGGALLLFKVKLQSLQNRPLEFIIDSPLPPPLREEGNSATIDLDV